MGFISRLYEWKLKTKIRKMSVPDHIVLALSESDLFADTRLSEFKFICMLVQRDGNKDRYRIY